MRFEQLLETFCQMMDLDHRDHMQDNGYRFTFDDQLTVTCFPEGDSRLILCGLVRRIPDDEHRAIPVLKNLLRINLGRMKNQSEIVSYDPETGELVVYRRIETDHMTGEDFLECMERFTNTLEFWCDAAADQPHTLQPQPMMFP